MRSLPDIQMMHRYAKEIQEDECEEILAKDDRAEHLRVLTASLKELSELFQTIHYGNIPIPASLPHRYNHRTL